MFIDWKDWCWSWSSNTLMWKAVKSCEELTHWKRPWCWERLRAGGEGGNRGWDGWIASLTQWTWVGANSRRWWRTGKLGVLQSMWLLRVRHHWVTKRVGHHWVTKLNWTWLPHENMSTRWTGLYYSLRITSTARNTADTSISLPNERSGPGSQCLLHKPVIW